MKPSEIQIDLFCPPQGLSQSSEMLEILRPIRWANGERGAVALVRIELVPSKDDRWMWGTTLNSQNGMQRSYRAMEKWGKFAATKPEALMEAVDELRAILDGATVEEQLRIKAWLGGLIAKAHHVSPSFI